MPSHGPSTLFSRILLIIGGLLVVGMSYWFIQTSLAPVPVPPVPPQPGAVRFDPSLDVSKNAVFFSLRPLGPDLVTPTIVGRPNPFALVIPSAAVTTTAATTTPTSQAIATSTIPIEPSAAVTSTSTSTAPTPPMP